MTGASERWEGMTAAELAAQLGLPGVIVRSSVTSTMDEAHRVAEDGAAAGTLILAETQRRGRGREGRPWHSPPGMGIWLTLVERSDDAASLEVLSLRVGLGAAAALQRFASEPVRVKWPNDLMLPRGKVAGILTEARWRASRPEWVAIGVGVNVVPGGTGHEGAALDPGSARREVLAHLVPALRAAAAARGPLDDDELAQWAARDWARGRRVRSPCVGTVRGISPAGALLVDAPGGTCACTSGSLLLEEPLA